jgi:hypothetical protein
MSLQGSVMVVFATLDFEIFSENHNFIGTNQTNNC